MSAEHHPHMSPSGIEHMISGAGVCERKALGIGHAIEPRRALDIGRQHVDETLL
jgi:hypothetical protein